MDAHQIEQQLASQRFAVRQQKQQEQHTITIDPKRSTSDKPRPLNLTYTASVAQEKGASKLTITAIQALAGVSTDYKDVAGSLFLTDVELTKAIDTNRDLLIQQAAAIITPVLDSLDKQIAAVTAKYDARPSTNIIDSFIEKMINSDDTLAKQISAITSLPESLAALAYLDEMAIPLDDKTLARLRSQAYPKLAGAIETLEYEKLVLSANLNSYHKVIGHNSVVKPTVQDYKPEIYIMDKHNDPVKLP